MKLIRLKINDKRGFRSLQEGFHIRFQNKYDNSASNNFYPYVLAGRNGSGKSNVLEALAEIFYHLDCIYAGYKPDYFDRNEENPTGFDSATSRIDAYELEYYTYLDSEIFPQTTLDLSMAHILVTKRKEERPQITWINQDKFRETRELSQAESKSLLPKYVIGYASGNNETLSFPFIKNRYLQFDEYLSTLASKEFVSPEPNTSLIYLDEVYSQAILLSTILMLDCTNEDEENDLLTPLKEYVGVEDIDKFRLIIRTDLTIFPPSNSNVQEDEVKEVRLIQNLDIKKPGERPNLTSYIEKLKSCATTWYDTYLTDLDDNAHDLSFDYNKSYLILDFKVNKETKKAFQFHFEQDPLKLFEVFQLLFLQDAYKVPIGIKKNIYTTQNVFLSQDIGYVPNEIDRILRVKNLKIKKSNTPKTIFTKELSDGEHQLLHILGLCLLFRKERCIFLLDEPETHFNPDWKAKFISSIRNCFKDDMPKCEMLITTHSPYLISDSDSKHVRVFKRIYEDDIFLQCEPPTFQTLGSSINKITIEIFGAHITVGDYALSKLQDINNRFKDGENSETLIAELEEKLGDSVEKTLLKHKISS